MSDPDTASAAAPIDAASAATAPGPADPAAPFADTASADADKASANADSCAADPKVFETAALGWEHRFDDGRTRRARCLELAISSVPSGGYYEPAHIVARAAAFDAYITGDSAD